MSGWVPAGRAARSMAANRSTGSAPELLLKLAVEEAMPGWVVLQNERNLPGAPDLWLPEARVAVFMHGCFWHSCQKCFPGGPSPSGPNAGKWAAKLARTVARDAEHEAALVELGVACFQLWECDVVAAPLECAATVAELAGWLRTIGRK